MKTVYGTNDVVYTADGPLGVRVWMVLPGGSMREITETVRRSYEAQMAELEEPQ